MGGEDWEGGREMLVEAEISEEHYVRFNFLVEYPINPPVVPKIE